MTGFRPDELAAYVAFAAIGSFTPGPNTMIALATGVHFGWRRVWPHALGVMAGVSAMLAMGIAGAIGVVLAVPGAGAVLRAVGVGYLLWLAWSIARSGDPRRRGLERPLAAWQSALLQFVNVKAWMLAIAVASTWFAQPGAAVERAAFAIAVFAAMTTAANYAWASAGQGLQAWLAVGRRRVLFDRTMGVALAASALSMLR
jgi:threonine/homoserine/homoserine lactone efflux protein